MIRINQTTTTIVKLFGLVILILSFAAFGEIAPKRGLNWQGPAKSISTPYIQGKYHAIIIGNTTYQDEDGVWRSLETPTNDADALADVLSNDYGFSNVAVLKDVGRRDILLAFNDLSKRVEPNDSVLVYYAGHGHLDERTKRGYWIPVDAKGKDDSTYIRNSTIRDELNIISERTKHTLLISDSCFSGALLRGGNRAATESEKTNPYYIKVSNKKSVQILAAGGVEFVDDNYRDSGHSPFTYFLISELKNNVDNLLTMSELAANVIKAVANNVDQLPASGVLQGAGDELGEFIFARISLKDSTVEVITGKFDQKNQNVELMKAIVEETKQEKPDSDAIVPMPRF